ncbi:MAG TPA: hypothetical protein VFN97_01705 [Actinospica sp.]|nr:hypothetical protein [Actinospica sp.]
MDPTGFSERTRQQTLFLMDGFCASPSPVLLIVGDAQASSKVAAAVYTGSGPWHDRPTRVGKLLQLDPASIATGPADSLTEMLATLESTDHWIYVPDVASLSATAVGRRFLGELMASVGNGGIAAMIASTPRDQLTTLRADAPRLLGFASMLDLPAGSDPGGYTSCRSLVTRSADPDDVGWTVSVRFELTEPVRSDARPASGPVWSALQLVDGIQLIVKDGAPPLGVLASLKPDAFTAGDEHAAFTTAALAAEQSVGRPLRPGERLVAARAIFYA